MTGFSSPEWESPTLDDVLTSIQSMLGGHSGTTRPTLVDTAEPDIRLMIVADAPIVRLGLVAAFEGARGIVVVETLSSSADAGLKAQRSRANLILVATNRKASPTHETVYSLRLHCPRLPVIVFAMHPDENDEATAFHSGASAYCEPDVTPQHLADLIRRIVIGGTDAPALLKETPVEVERERPSVAPDDEEQTIEMLLFRSITDQERDSVTKMFGKRLTSLKLGRTGGEFWVRPHTP